MGIRKFVSSLLCALALCGAISHSAFSQELSDAQQSAVIHDITITGLKRTNRDWMLHYLGLTLPSTVTKDDLKAIENKLWTTGVFTLVEVKLDASNDTKQTLVINVEEKWTTIPVVRAAFGGGTPLTVLGVYDTHVFGSLWTVGGEIRRYGDAPIGGTAWIRAPRWQQGYHLLSLELWQDNRIRSVYDDKNESVGEFDTRAKMLRAQFLVPFSQSQTSRERGLWQYGMETKLRLLEPTRYKTISSMAPSSIEWNGEQTHEYFLLAKLVFDDLIESRLNLEGTRFSLSAGPVVRKEKTGSAAEFEWFYFWLFPGEWNLGSHLLIGDSSERQLSDLYFLGGFDSIRGFPDGALVGNKAVYANLELRKTAARWRYVWLQPAIFADAGSAAFDWDSLEAEKRVSAGMGVRIAVPQVHRLVFRIDYAWSLGEPRSHGITAGMNQFFQPHKPL